MAKKVKKSMLPVFIMAAALVFAVLAIVFSVALDFAGTKLVTTSSTTKGSIYKGTDVFFGTKDNSGNQVLVGSTLGLVGFIMMIVGAVALLAGLAISFKKVKIGKFVAAVAGLVLVVAGIFMFIAPGNFVSTNAEKLNGVLGGLAGLVGAKAEVVGTLQTGAILSGIFGLVSGIVGIGAAAVK